MRGLAPDNSPGGAQVLPKHAHIYTRLTPNITETPPSAGSAIAWEIVGDVAEVRGAPRHQVSICIYALFVHVQCACNSGWSAKTHTALCLMLADAQLCSPEKSAAMSVVTVSGV